jgi:signal transduction histidine kinase
MLDRLQASSEAQRRFVADASHELRTPIANIRMAVEVASAHPERADWVSVADDVLHQDARMQRLTDDLLLLARAEAGQPIRSVAPVDVDELVAAELRRPVPADRTLRAADTSDRTRPITVLGDADELRRMLTNLVDNALRHAARDVTIGLRVQPDNSGTDVEGMVEITVSDDGPGIAPADRAIIFDPFVRLDQHRGRDHGGTGLGLSIVHRVVLAHHGTVRVEDSERGATFVVTVPAAPVGPPRFPA